MKKQPDTNGPVPALAVELDLTTASNVAFLETVKKFSEWDAVQPPLGPFTLKTGWQFITPLLAQEMLRRNANNRKPGLATIKKYHYSMAQNDWHKTGQSLVFNADGKMNEGQHRCWACYLGKVPFETFIVTDVPVEPDLFSYYDDVKPRSAADALYTAGNDGIARDLAAAIVMHHRYENDALGIMKQPPYQKLNNREVLHYSRQFASLRETGHYVLANYPKAVSVIGSKAKGVTIFFSDRVIELYGQEMLEKFFGPLGTGAQLAEDSPINGCRTRLLKGQDELAKEHILALLIKAFLLFLAGKKLTKRGLFLQDNEDYPKLEVPFTPVD